ncbi:hypothetical protein ACET66_17790 [Aeromonas simiae]|uniref:hypothetical protein n=1 Tax=Aeromonas simiae TaxID=218936 RepID=UPI0038D0BA26
MNYLRVISFSAMTIICTFFIWEDLFKYIFHVQQESYQINGIQNLWAIFAGFFSGIIIVIYCVIEITEKKSAVKFINRGIIISCAIIAPLLAIASSVFLNHKASGYIKCERLSKSSYRFSVRTYAIDHDTCLKLEKTKRADN